MAAQNIVRFEDAKQEIKPEQPQAQCKTPTVILWELAKWVELVAYASYLASREAELLRLLG